MEIGETLYVATRQEWRRWLAKKHHTQKEIWLIFYKKATGKPSLTYDEAVEEAICYGWIDNWEKSMDKERYALRFALRKKGSNWSEPNRARALKLLQAGRITKAGLATLPQEVLADWQKQRR